VPVTSSLRIGVYPGMEVYCNNLDPPIVFYVDSTNPSHRSSSVYVNSLLFSDLAARQMVAQP